MMTILKKQSLKLTENKIVIKLFDSGVKFFVPLLQRQKIKLALRVRHAMLMIPF
jgi:hypothetical protein